MKLEEIPTARIVVSGGPRCGKTTFCQGLEALGFEVRHTDALIERFEWSQASLLASTWLEHPGPWCCEGTTMVRALRKFCARHPGTSKPCDVLFWFGLPRLELSDGQASMLKSVHTILTGILPELQRRGVEVKMMSERAPETT